MDLSKAFDTLDHSTGLKYHGIYDNELIWLSSYLTNRPKYVELDGTWNHCWLGRHKVQSLDPCLFYHFMNDIPQSGQYFKYIHYADYTTLFTIVQFRSAKQIDINDEWSNVPN